MSHVVPRYLWPDANTGWLELPPQQIAPVDRASARIGEYQIARISMLRSLPS